MNFDPVEDPGYESPTGERDIPTCSNFETNTPVDQKWGFVPGQKVLNRKGRGICRIMASYRWTHGDIANIFRVSSQSVSRAVANLQYIPRDRVANDYDNIDPEFRLKYPPKPDYYLSAPQIRRRETEGSRGKAIKRELPDEEYDELLKAETSERAAKALCVSRVNQTTDNESGEADDDELDEDEMIPWAPHKRTPTTANEINVPKRPRYAHNTSAGQERSTSSPTVVALSSSPRRSPEINRSPSPPRKPLAAPRTQPIPLPRRSLLAPRPAKAQSTAPGLAGFAGFLKTMCDVDFSSHQALLSALGFTVERLYTLATWRKDELQEVLTRLLSEDAAAAVGCAPMNTFTAITFEITIRALKCVPPAQVGALINSAPISLIYLLTRTGHTQAPLTRSLLPPPSTNATNSGTTLPLFLRNVMGLDLSAHQNLLNDQGCDIATLCAMVVWERGQLQEVLRRGLGGQKSGAMQALEVLALEFCIRRAREV
ncbi:hypothetical protein C8F04DRAFT_1261520 [Mycena alexandri]|uniref:Uncharacterized protein n=1 Tax=Mycena alexandri TaxID=1745969 RepID=A0AAD6X2Z8_9AGAR|nr:hypothetical protein C8F04DRAFT_1261520 [Mycena alexandri]